MKHPPIYIALLWALLFCTPNLLAQEPAGFEVEGDVFTSSTAITNDWFSTGNGREVISLDSTAIFRNYINSQSNIPFSIGMSVPDMSIVGGRVWYTAHFGHDPLASDTDANPRAEDPSRFAPWNYTENPEDWAVVQGYLEPWVDLTDSYVHLRREGMDPQDHLFLFGGLSALKIKKGRFLDMEFYVSDLEVQGTNFTNAGPEGGHTAWKFDAAGKVISPGDLDLGFAAENGNVIRTEVYIWVSRKDFDANRGFVYEVFRAPTKEATYGYARIATDPEMSIASNNAPSPAPPWGTHNRKMRVENHYKNRQMLEFGLDLSALGLDPAQYAVDMDPCSLPWRKMLVKSRKSTDIGAFLEDFAGPYQLFNQPVEPAPAGTIIAPPPFNSCTPGDSRRLRAVNQDPDYIYTWRSLDAGHTFPNGSEQMSGQGLFEVAIDKPGNYELRIRPATFCGEAGQAGSARVNAVPCAQPDYIEVAFNRSTVIAPAENDIDLEEDIDPRSISTDGLQAPAHGTITIAGTGEITYTPNNGYTGPDSFEYRICDRNGLCDTALVEIQVNSSDPPPTIDSDGDGVSDSQDLDDDNDGIPDHLEMQELPDRTQPDCQGEFALDFSQEAILESGTDKALGSIYRIPSISPGIDALVSVTAMHNAQISFIDRNNEATHAFRPSTSFEFMKDGEQGMVEYTIRFVEAGTYAPKVLGVLFMNFNDIDGTTNYGEQTWAFNPMSYIVSDPTELTMEGEGQWLIGTSGTTDYDQATNQNPQVNFGISFASRSEIKVRVGAVARKNGKQTTTRQHNIEFQCVTNYINPLNVNLDADYDGIANHLDLDSDNDGIFDAWEAGHGLGNAAGVVTGTYGSNGLANSVETSPDSGSINYMIRDTDASGLPDFLNSDSDGDGCSDANEAYADAARDGGDNPYYGLGSPPAVDPNGLLRNAPYTRPADADVNGVADHLQPAQDIIISSPVNAEVCPGDEVRFSATVADNSIVRWEEYIEGLWQEVPADERIQGRNSNTLQWVHIVSSDNGRQFRVAAAAPGQVCEQYSDPATLTVGAVPPVQANASATAINAGEWVTLTGSGASSYRWDKGVQDGEPVQLFRTTTFTVTGWDENGCATTDEITVEVNSLVDLELALNSSKTRPNVGDTVDLQFVLSNKGPNRATGVQVITVIPDGILITSMGPGATLTGNLLKWEIDLLEPGTTSLDVSAQMLRPEKIAGEYQWIAQVVRSEQEDADSSPANFDEIPREDDEVMLEFPTPSSELSLNKSIDGEIVAIQDTIQFRVDVFNHGPFTATGIAIEERLPTGYDWLWSTTDRGNYNPATGIWSLDSLEVDQRATLDLFARVNDTEDYLNTAAILQALQWDQDTTNNQGRAGVSRVYKEADLSLTKTGSSNYAEVGDLLNFRLQVANAGPDHATDVVVEDRVPPGYTIISAGQGGKIDGNQISWKIDELPPGEQELTYVLQVNPPLGTADEYRNLALITNSRQEDPDSDQEEVWSGKEDDEASWEITIPPADFLLHKSISQEEAAVGDQLSFEITIENTGSYNITNLQLEDLLPGGYELLHVDLSHGTYNEANGLWDLPVLAKGETASLGMQVKVTMVDDYTNVVQFLQMDQALSNEVVTSASAGLSKVHRTADLSLRKSADSESAEVGDLITFTLLVSNAGPDHATNVVIEDRVPQGFTIIDADQQGQINNNLITWEIDDIPPGQHVLTYTLQVNPPTGEDGEYVNIAQIKGSSQEDPDSSPGNEGGEDDEDQWEFKLTPASLIVTKSISTEEASVGEVIEFVVSIENTSSYRVTGLVLEDRLPGGYTLLHYTVHHGEYDPGNGQWMIPALDPGETSSLTMEVEVTEVAAYLNVARLLEADPEVSPESITSDSAGLNNIHQQADLSLVKTADMMSPAVGDIVTFSLQVSNAGPAHATAVVIEDRVPSGFSILSAGQDGTINGNLITWEIPDLPPGEIKLTYQLQVNPPTGAEGEYRNIAQITHSDQNDPDSDPGTESDGVEDDEGSWEINPPSASLYIEKTVSKEEVVIGERIEFRVAVTNTGGGNVTNLVMADRLPQGYLLHNFTLTHGFYDQRTGLWEIPVLEIGETALMIMEVEVTEIDDYLNIASIHHLDQWISDDQPTYDEAGITLRGDCLVVFNEFSPNEDGANDHFYIDCIEHYPNNHVQVFDRWGNKVFEASGYQNDWNGENQHPNALDGQRELPVGTYYYLLHFGDGSTPDKSGWLYISR